MALVVGFAAGLCGCESSVPRSSVPIRAVAPTGEVHGTVLGLSPDDGPIVVVAHPTFRSSRRQPPQTAVVLRTDDSFETDYVIVPQWQTVRFSNEESICHRYFSSSPSQPFDTGALNPGQSSSVRFDHPGELHVYCSLHGDEGLSIFVSPTPDYALVEAGEGTFEIDRIPPGRWELAVWQAGAEVHRESVEVDAIKTIQVELDVRTAPPSVPDPGLTE